MDVNIKVNFQNACTIPFNTICIYKDFTEMAPGLI